MSGVGKKPLPAGWKWAKLRDIGPIADGDWILNSDYSKEGVRLLQVGDVGIGTFIGKSSRYVTEERAKQLNCTFLKEGDILISRMPDPMGRACVLPLLGYPCITAVDVSIYRPKPSIADQHYLKAYFCSPRWFNDVIVMASGATRPRISRGNLEQLEVPLPPLAEQKRIVTRLAEQLAAVEKARAAAEARLAAARALPAAFLRQVFPKPGQDLPAGWKLLKLHEIADTVNGVGFPEYLQGRQGLPYLLVKVSDMNKVGSEVTIESAANTVDDSLLKQLGGKVYPSGTIVFPKVGGALLTNKRRILGRPGCFDNNVMGIVPKSIDKDYLYHWFCTIDLRKLANTQALPSIKQSTIASLDLPVPSPAEQKHIVSNLGEQLAAVKKMCIAVGVDLNEIIALPAKLLEKAFNGEI
jgi:type I restriction enzyme S subunit